MRFLHTTGALCPTCLKEYPAEVYADEDNVVWMSRECPDHGRLDTRMWPDADHYECAAKHFRRPSRKTRTQLRMDAHSVAARARVMSAAGRFSRLR